LRRMIEELRKLVETRLSEAPGLVAMVISDLEGVPILQAQVAGGNNQGGGGEAVADICMRYQFTSAQAGANDKCGRLGLEGHKKSLVSYQDYQILTVSHHAVLLTVVASAKANAGIMDNFAKRMEPLVNDIATAVIAQS